MDSVINLLVAAVLASASISVAAVYLPALQALLGTAPIPAAGLALIALSVLFAPVLSSVLDALFRPGRGGNTQAQIKKTRVRQNCSDKAPFLQKQVLTHQEKYGKL